MGMRKCQQQALLGRAGLPSVLLMLSLSLTLFGAARCCWVYIFCFSALEIAEIVGRW